MAPLQRRSASPSHCAFAGMGARLSFRPARWRIEYGGSAQSPAYQQHRGCAQDALIRETCLGIYWGQALRRTSLFNSRGCEPSVLFDPFAGFGFGIKLPHIVTSAIWPRYPNGPVPTPFNYGQLSLLHADNMPDSKIVRDGVLIRTGIAPFDIIHAAGLCFLQCGAPVSPGALTDAHAPGASGRFENRRLMKVRVART
jgi:hypothetical protein